MPTAITVSGRTVSHVEAYRGEIIVKTESTRMVTTVTDIISSAVFCLFGLFTMVKATKKTDTTNVPTNFTIGFNPEVYTI
jgi:hypothetical protein